MQKKEAPWNPTPEELARLDRVHKRFRRVIYRIKCRYDAGDPVQAQIAIIKSLIDDLYCHLGIGLQMANRMTDLTHAEMWYSVTRKLVDKKGKRWMHD